jgi:hypothetical protein
MGACDLGLTKKSNYVKIILFTELVKGVKVGKTDFLVSPSFRKLKHTVNQVSPLRGFAPLSRRDSTLLTVGEAQRNLRTRQHSPDLSPAGTTLYYPYALAYSGSLHIIYFTLLNIKN